MQWWPKGHNIISDFAGGALSAPELVGASELRQGSPQGALALQARANLDSYGMKVARPGSLDKGIWPPQGSFAILHRQVQLH
jgi:hypothetical protein